MASSSQRADLVKKALLVERVSMAWMVVEAAVALISGIAAYSVSLIAFGFNSALELVAGAVVYAQLRGESRPEGGSQGEERERTALWAVGVTLWLLCIYVLVDAATALLRRRVPQKTPAGFAVALAAIVLTPLLARAKLRLGRAIPNRALVADAKETMACGWLSIAVLLGAGLYANRGWWWADSAAALAMIPFLVREGQNAIRLARAK